MSFQIRALNKRHFEPLFDFDDQNLALNDAVRMVANEKPGFPCRVQEKILDSPAVEYLHIHCAKPGCYAAS